MSGKKSHDKDQALRFQGRLLLYRSESGETRLEVRLQDETVWMT